MMRGISRCFLLGAAAFSLVVCSLAGAGVDCGGTHQGHTIEGAIGLVTKYDSNIELRPGVKTRDLTDAFIHEPQARLSVNRSIGDRGWLDAEVFGLANWHLEHQRKNWYFGVANLALDYNLGKSQLSFSNDFRNYTIPQADTVGFVRNTGMLTYKRALSPFWKLNLGYENVATYYPENSALNYVVNGVLVEVRNTWSSTFSSYYSYDFQHYHGSYNAEFADPVSSPEKGFRHTFKIGFDWVLNRNSLSGSYFIQTDDSSGEGLNQIGGFEGNEESLDLEAEFNYLKHKGTLLYARRFTARLTLSSYQEFVLKDLSKRNSPTTGPRDQDDALLLSSEYLKFKLYNHWFLKSHYLLRMKRSTLKAEDYRDHMLSIGAECRF